MNRARTEYLSPKSGDTIYIDDPVPGMTNDRGEPIQRYESVSSRSWKHYVHWLTAESVAAIIAANDLRRVATEEY